MTPTLHEAVAQRLGVPADADEATVLAALDTLAEVPVASLPEGIVTIDAGTLDTLRAQAARGQEAFEAQAQARREGAVDAAVRAGKVPPARRAHWLSLLAADEEGATATLDALAPGLIPVDAERGHAHDRESGGLSDDELYVQVFGTEG